jgi:hypothetical protein
MSLADDETVQRFINAKESFFFLRTYLYCFIQIITGTLYAVWINKKYFPLEIESISLRICYVI